MRDHNSSNNSKDHQNFHPNNQHHNYLDDKYYKSKSKFYFKLS